MQRIDPTQLNSADYPAEIEIKIDWSEIDVLGHVNNVMINKYMQAARIHVWGEIGMDTQFAKLNIEPMVASTSVQFLKPLYFPGNIKVKSRIAKISTSSYAFEHILLSDQEEIAAYGYDVVVNYDFPSQKSQPIDDVLKAKLESFKTV